jgi:Zn-dependent protease
MVTHVVIALAVVVLHELGHLAAAFSLGIPVKRVGVTWKGMYIVRETGPAMANLITTLAGPLLNLALAIAWPVSREFALANMVFAIGNLLPLQGSDGLRALALLSKGRLSKPILWSHIA